MKSNENVSITIYAPGLVHCSICAPKNLKRKKLERLVNEQNPTGISSKWKISEDNFATGEQNPCVCDSDSSRMHYLMSC